MTEHTIAIAFTCIEAMFSRFFRAWLALEVGPPSEVPRHVEIGGAITHARNQCVRWFLGETSCDYLLMLDQDHDLPVNLLERVARYQEPVVGALYYGRNEPHPPIAMGPNVHWLGPDGRYHDLRQDQAVWGGDWEGGKIAWLVPSQERHVVEHPALYPVCVVGAGCLAIRRDVLEGWPEGRPWFTFGLSEAGDVVGEDVWFCRELARQGIPVHLDSGIVLPHMTVKDVTRATHQERLRRVATAHGVPFR